MGERSPSYVPERATHALPGRRASRSFLVAKTSDANHGAVHNVYYLSSYLMIELVGEQARPQRRASQFPDRRFHGRCDLRSR